jgi:predicted NUDIX family NTP pyrophosphohydrolase
VISAGLLVFRRGGSGPEFLLGHPGGPLWARKNEGAWMIPKGEIQPGEAPLAAARREFAEETGLAAPQVWLALSPVRQAGGKQVLAWLAEADLDLTGFNPGRFEMDWPPRSGRRAQFAEIDRLDYFDGPRALLLILPSQAPLIREGLERIGEAAPR